MLKEIHNEAVSMYTGFGRMSVKSTDRQVAGMYFVIVCVFVFVCVCLYLKRRV